MRASRARRSKCEEGGLVAALEADVEMEDVAVRARDEGGACIRVEALEDRVGRVGLLLVGEVDSRDQVPKEAAREHQQVEVWGLRPPVWSWQPGGLADSEVENALRVRAAPGELVALPDLEQSVGDRISGPIEQLALDAQGAPRVRWHGL